MDCAEMPWNVYIVHSLYAPNTTVTLLCCAVLCHVPVWEHDLVPYILAVRLAVSAPNLRLFRTSSTIHIVVDFRLLEHTVIWCGHDQISRWHSHDLVLTR